MSKQLKTKPWLLLVVPIALSLGLFWLASQRSTGPRRQSITLSPSPLLTPSPTPSPTSSPNPSSIPKPSPSERANPQKSAKSVKLTVPFTPQAPDGQWVEPWKEGCEEAALLMAHAYNQGDRRALLPASEYKQKIADMVSWQHQRFGGHYDIGPDEMAIIAKEYLGYQQVKIGVKADLDDLRQELRANRPVIVVGDGRKLKNPYFVQPGPPYHVFLLTGFEGTDFIANENGTKRGHNYRYSSAILTEALGDYRREVGLTKPIGYLVLEQ